MTAAAAYEPDDDEPDDDEPDAARTRLVDWDVAHATARRLVRPGPSVTASEARAVVADLRERAAAAEVHVARFTELQAPSGTAPVLVVDRPGWVQANTAAFDHVLSPLAEAVSRRADGPGRATTAFGARIAGVEAGALLAYLSARVLGQFDPFHAAGDERGRLLLVAPNVVHLERELGVDPGDFRLWVCLHEETHRVQFTAVPWLREHLLAEIRAFVEATDLEPGALLDRVRDTVGQLAGSLRGGSDGSSIVELVQTPAQREVLDRVLGLMSLLEGHAEFVMDGVGPEVVGSVEQIRQKFSKRRGGGGPVDQLVRRLLGMDLKLRQYRDGAAFVRHVVDAVGVDGFNRVWSSPSTLPLRDEITDPDAWLHRVT